MNIKCQYRFPQFSASIWILLSILILVEIGIIYLLVLSLLFTLDSIASSIEDGIGDPEIIAGVGGGLIFLLLGVGLMWFIFQICLAWYWLKRKRILLSGIGIELQNNKYDHTKDEPLRWLELTNVCRNYRCCGTLLKYDSGACVFVPKRVPGHKCFVDSIEAFQDDGDIDRILSLFDRMEPVQNGN